MLCGKCYGTGKLTGAINGVAACYPLVPCTECGGSGVVHCCDGLREQMMAAAYTSEMDDDLTGEPLL